jgi:hypothetical protein
LGDQGLNGRMTIEWNLNKYNVEWIQLAHDEDQCGALMYTQDYWVFRLCPSSAILKTREHNVSENGSVSVLR